MKAGEPFDLVVSRSLGAGATGCSSPLPPLIIPGENGQGKEEKIGFREMKVTSSYILVNFLVAWRSLIMRSQLAPEPVEIGAFKINSNNLEWETGKGGESFSVLFQPRLSSPTRF